MKQIVFNKEKAVEGLVYSAFCEGYKDGHENRFYPDKIDEDLILYVRDNHIDRILDGEGDLRLDEIEELISENDFNIIEKYSNVDYISGYMFDIKDYVKPETKKEIKKGTKVSIGVCGTLLLGLGFYLWSNK